MGDIYEHGYITIAATWSSDGDGGCFFRHAENYRAEKLLTADLYVEETRPGFPFHSSSFGTRENDERVVNYFPLLERGWVYQERRLSSRMVHFGKSQIFWECNSGFASQDGYQGNLGSHAEVDEGANREDGRADIRRDLPVYKMVEDPVLSWRKTVLEYTTLNLTYESDRLPALSALAARMLRRREGVGYIAGMWRDSLLADLAWTRGHRLYPRSETLLPSWSWAATRGAVLYQAVLRPMVELVDLNYTSHGPPQLGKVRDAKITLRAPFRKVYFDMEEAKLNRWEQSESDEVEELDFNEYLRWDAFRFEAIPERAGKMSENFSWFADSTFEPAYFSLDRMFAALLLGFEDRGVRSTTDGRVRLDRGSGWTTIRRTKDEGASTFRELHFVHMVVECVAESKCWKRIGLATSTSNHRDEGDRYLASLPVKEFSIV
jgi:hypothetical protein